MNISNLEDFTWENYKVISDSLVKIDEFNIGDALVNQASMYSYYHGLMCAAKHIAGDKSNLATHIAATIRKNMRSSSSTKVSVSQADDAVDSDQEYMDVLRDVNDATFKYELLKGLVKALEQKKDMLQQVSANKREETKLYN